MIYCAITGEKEIESAQEQFSAALKKDARLYENWTVGFRGGTDKVDLYWHRDLKFWYGHKRLLNRHWNIFGATPPESRRSLNIDCEINVPYMGRMSNIQGIFVKAKSGADKIFVAHQGRLTITDQDGEGKKFLDWVRTTYGDRQILKDIHWDDTKITEAIIVAALDDPKFLRSVKDFIVKVVNFKNVKRGVHTFVRT